MLSACKSTVTSNDLTGKWVYTKVEYLNQSPVLVEQEEDLELKSPMIIFNEDGKAQILSDQKIISKGQYTLEAPIIRYEEVLPEGIKRKIPFLIKSLENNVLVFESMDQNTIRITAKKVE